MRKFIIARRGSQTFFLFLFIYILWSTTYPLKGLLPTDTFFKINPLIIFITSISERLILPGVIFSFLMLILTLLLGRFFCGWVCPLGTVSDAINSLNLKRKRGKLHILSKSLRLPKFYALFIIFIFAIIGIQIAWVLDPLVIMARFVSLNLIPAITFAVDKMFVTLIRGFNLYGGAVYDFYHGLKASMLGINLYYFSHSLIILLFFIIICISVLFVTRFWCRSICPLGALYALFAKFSYLRRIIYNCTQCDICRIQCRMGAINDDLSYIKNECILCMDCIYNCPQHVTSFKFGAKPEKKQSVDTHNTKGSLARGDFLLLLSASFFSLGFSKRGIRDIWQGSVIRPPAALVEDEFLNRCIRCGNCMKVCITNGLQPTLLQTGIEGIWTPHLVFEIGYCEYQCTLCGNVCPTGAIPALSEEEKKKTKLGLARIERSICLPWASQKQCIVCEEHCPVPQKAIKLEKEFVGDTVLLKPFVDNILCVGCGICQKKCPVRPIRAIRVFASHSHRSTYS